ncbi:MAG TPA: TIGR01459 family HAD-type hydrolase, partial [Parvularculaceae bacterium]|nr:TIGR01459 family HAD-type hydrolase [Parvularculaceae bacterium]
HFLAGLSEIADRFDAVLCDAWGVIHNGVALFPGVEDALANFRKQRGPVVILTNAPRPSAIIPAQLDRIGLSRNAYDAVVTSGDATRAAIEALAPGTAFRLGPDKDLALYENLDVRFAPLEEADFIVCTGLVDDSRETPADYADLLKNAALRRLPMVCANPDIVVRWGDRLIYCAGALAEAYEALGGEVVYGGKPHAPIYDLALAVLEKKAGDALDRRRVLAIGDGAKTDIAGANRNGFPVLFIAAKGGVHDDGVDQASISRALERACVRAEFAATELKW